MDPNVKLFRTRVKIGNWNQERYLEEVCFESNDFIHVSYTTRYLAALAKTIDFVFFTFDEGFHIFFLYYVYVSIWMKFVLFGAQIKRLWYKKNIYIFLMWRRTQID